MNRADQKRQILQRSFRDAAARQWAEPVLVRSVMTPQPFCVTPQHTAAQLVDLFHANRFRHFLVAEAGKLVGVISDRDVIRLFGTTDSLEPAYLESVHVADLMSTDLVTISADATLGHAARAELTLGLGVVGVVAVQRRHVVRDRQAGLAGGQERAEARVRVLGRPEAGEHPHRPEPGAVSGRVDPSRERWLAGQTDVAERVEVVPAAVLGIAEVIAMVVDEGRSAAARRLAVGARLP